MPNSRALPAVHRLLDAPMLADARAGFGRLRVKRAITEVLARTRARLQAESAAAAPDTATLVRAVELALIEQGAAPMRAVVNATGTLLHTNLGRAQLPAAAAAAVTIAAQNTVNLEFDLSTGMRGHRDAEVAELLCQLTGAEAATVVNNTAAALLLTLNTLAQGEAVPVSRGELIEIGGSFRLPDIMARSGARLREVGTTNRTWARDYEEALLGGAAMVLRVHPSNYEVRGFTHREDDATLARLAHAYDRPFVVDLGSGALVDLSRFGAPREPLPQEVLAQGADLVMFSGDKLLGGPQAGLIVGKRALITRIDANPLKRALRLDKLGLTALAAVLKLYGEPDRLTSELPLLRQLGRPLDELHSFGAAVIAQLDGALPAGFTVELVTTTAQLGSGSQPLARIPSMAIALRSTATQGQGALLDKALRALRAGTPPVIGRIEEQRVLLDLRTIEDPLPLAAALRGLAHALQPNT